MVLQLVYLYSYMLTNSHIFYAFATNNYKICCTCFTFVMVLDTFHCTYFTLHLSQIIQSKFKLIVLQYIFFFCQNSSIIIFLTPAYLGRKHQDNGHHRWLQLFSIKRLALLSAFFLPFPSFFCNFFQFFFPRDWSHLPCLLNYFTLIW